MGGVDTQSVNGTQPVKLSVNMADANNIQITNLRADYGYSKSNKYKKDGHYNGKYSVNCRGINKKCHSFTKKDVSFSAAIVKANFYTFGAGLEAILHKHL